MSEHAQYVLLFYAHAYWLGGTEHATDASSVCMPIIITNSKLRGAEQDSVPHVMKVILTTFLLSVGL